MEISLLYCLREIRLSGLALEIELEDMETPQQTVRPSGQPEDGSLRDPQ